MANLLLFVVFNLYWWLFFSHHSTGSCQTDMFNKSFNAGNANGKLQFENGIVFLNYSGGDKCHQGKFERNTIINFVCNPSANVGQPMFIDESDDCTYYFSWHTSLVCEKQVNFSFIVYLNSFKNEMYC